MPAEMVSNSEESIDNGVSVTGAAQQSDLVTVLLTTTPHVEGAAYTLTVNGVEDRAATPNPIDPDTQVAFVSTQSVTLEIRIAASSDDVEEQTDGGVLTDSGDLELVDPNAAVGLRFHPVDLPPDSTISQAWVQFKVDETGSAAAELTVEGQASDDAEAFGTVTTRPRTSASTGWEPPAWNAIGEAGPDQRTPNLASIIQEIVDRPGWQTGNALALIVTGSGVRTAESYDGDSSGAPLLHIEYSGSTQAGEPPEPPTGVQVQ